MTDTWREALSEVDNVAPSPDLWDLVLQQELDQIPRESPHRGVVPAVAIALLIAVLSGGIIFSIRSLGTEHPNPSSPTFSREQGVLPLGAHVTLAEAQAGADFPIYRPDDSLASDSSIRSVQIQTTTGDAGTVSEVAIDYQSGVLETVMPANSILAKDPLAFYTARAKEDQGRTVQTVQGQPALVIERNIEGSGNPASVSFVLDGSEVTLFGLYAPIEAKDLLQLASTVG